MFKLLNKWKEARDKKRRVDVILERIAQKRRDFVRDDQTKANGIIEYGKRHDDKR